MILRTGNDSCQSSAVSCQQKKFFDCKLEAGICGLKKGFTLVEVLLSLAVLSIGLVGVLRAYAIGLDTLGAGQETIDGVYLAQEKMAQIEVLALEQNGIISQSKSGAFGESHPGYLWEWEARDVDSQKGVQEVTLAVRNPEKARQFSLTTYMEGRTDEE